MPLVPVVFTGQLVQFQDWVLYLLMPTVIFNNKEYHLRTIDAGCSLKQSYECFKARDRSASGFHNYQCYLEQIRGLAQSNNASCFAISDGKVFGFQKLITVHSSMEPAYWSSTGHWVDSRSHPADVRTGLEWVYGENEKYRKTQANNLYQQRRRSLFAAPKKRSQGQVKRPKPESKVAKADKSNGKKAKNTTVQYIGSPNWPSSSTSSNSPVSLSRTATCEGGSTPISPVSPASYTNWSVCPSPQAAATPGSLPSGNLAVPNYLLEPQSKASRSHSSPSSVRPTFEGFESFRGMDDDSAVQDDDFFDFDVDYTVEGYEYKNGRLLMTRNDAYSPRRQTDDTSSVDTHTWMII